MGVKMKGLGAVVLVFITGFLLFADDGKKGAAAAQSLKELAAPHRLLIGAGVTRGKLRTPPFKELLLKHHNALTPENELKFDALKRVADSYNFTPADEVVNFGADNGFKVRGHTLVWHAAVPAWFRNKTWTRESLLAFLKDYITTVVTRYKGKITWLKGYSGCVRERETLLSSSYCF